MFTPGFAEALRLLNEPQTRKRLRASDPKIGMAALFIDLMAGELLNEDYTDAHRQLAAGMQAIRDGRVVAGYVTMADAYDVLQKHDDARAALDAALELAPENPDVKIAAAHHDFYHRRNAVGIEGPLAVAWDIYRNAAPPGRHAQERAGRLLQSAYDEFVEDGGMTIYNLPSALRQYVETIEIELLP